MVTKFHGVQVLIRITGASSGHKLKIKLQKQNESLEKDEKPILLRVLLQCFYVFLEDDISILVTRVSFHELIIHGNKTKGKHRVITVCSLVPRQMLLDNQLLQHSVVNRRNWSLIRFKEIRLCLRYSGHICNQANKEIMTKKDIKDLFFFLSWTTNNKGI